MMVFRLPGLSPMSGSQRWWAAIRCFPTCLHRWWAHLCILPPLQKSPFCKDLMASGMGKGPALALLLAGPSLSLPNMLVIRGIIGNQKTAVYVVAGDCNGHHFRIDFRRYVKLNTITYELRNAMKIHVSVVILTNFNRISF